MLDWATQIIGLLCQQLVVPKVGLTCMIPYNAHQAKSVKLKVINAATQKGNTDCGLYAVAMMTSITYKEDQVNII